MELLPTAFPMQQQQEPDWCWDACSVSLEHYFNPASRLTQSAFAVQALGVPLADCDQPFYLQDALADLGLLNGATLPGFMSFSQIQQQLDANLPVCLEIEWYGGEGCHYVVITGYGQSPAGKTQLYISDPILPGDNVTVWDYDAFVFTYSPSYTTAEGEWTETFLVQPGVSQ
jgi:hypothetical protein